AVFTDCFPGGDARPRHFAVGVCLCPGRAHGREERPRRVTMPGGPVVVKVGGSLFDLPDLGQRLQGWLNAHAMPQAVLIPGGGPTADGVRALDRRFGLGEEKAHWLALRAMTLNAYFLANLLERATVVGSAEACARVWGDSGLPVLDAFAFAERDDAQPGHLPHSWDVTSDALAARVAQVLQARQL